MSKKRPAFTKNLDWMSHITQEKSVTSHDLGDKDNDNDHSSNKVSVQIALNCPEGQSAWALVHSLVWRVARIIPSDMCASLHSWQCQISLAVSEKTLNVCMTKPRKDHNKLQKMHNTGHQSRTLWISFGPTVPDSFTLQRQHSSTHQ